MGTLNFDLSFSSKRSEPFQNEDFEGTFAQMQTDTQHQHQRGFQAWGLGRTPNGLADQIGHAWSRSVCLLLAMTALPSNNLGNRD